jgi:hypothetical protein
VTKVKQRRRKRKTAKARGRKPARKPDARSRRVAAKIESPRVVKLKELDPLAKCGPNTSVERLFRVDETIKGVSTAHLVFFDRHGLYCEHGRNCPAGDDVRRAHRNLDWTRKVG